MGQSPTSNFAPASRDQTAATCLVASGGSWKDDHRPLDGGVRGRDHGQAPPLPEAPGVRPDALGHARWLSAGVGESAKPSGAEPPIPPAERSERSRSRLVVQMLRASFRVPAASFFTKASPQGLHRLRPFIGPLDRLLSGATDPTHDRRLRMDSQHPIVSVRTCCAEAQTTRTGWYGAPLTSLSECLADSAPLMGRQDRRCVPPAPDPKFVLWTSPCQPQEATFSLRVSCVWAPSCSICAVRSDMCRANFLLPGSGEVPTHNVWLVQPVAEVSARFLPLCDVCVGVCHAMQWFQGIHHLIIWAR